MWKTHNSEAREPLPNTYDTRDTMYFPRQPDTSILDQDIRELLQALPTRTNIEALILRLEETHRRDIQEVGGEVSNLTDRVATGKVSINSLESRESEQEQARDQHHDNAVALQLHLEDIENQSRHNNLQL